MNSEEQQNHFKILTDKIRETQISKQGDYATTDDVLSNFKVAGANCGLSAGVQCLSLISTKVARLGVLLQSENSPNHESIRDSVMDLANYSILLDMILADKWE
jgi:hypothetical protein